MLKTRSIYILVLLSILALLACAVWYGIFSTIRNNLISAATLENKAEKSLLTQNQDQSLSTFISENTDQVNGIESRIISSDGTVDFINTIESLARTIGNTIVVNSVNLNPSPDQNPSFQNLTLIVTVQGSWTSIYRFISIIQSLPYKVSVDSITLSGTNSGKGSLWSASLTFDVLKHT